MGKEVSIRKSFKHGYILDEKELRRIYNILVEQMNIASPDEDFTNSFQMVFRNKIVEEKSSIEEVFSESNAGAWEIQSLEINLRCKNPFLTPRILLSFSKNPYVSISYTIEGKDRNWVYITGSLLDERIAKISQSLISFLASTIFLVIACVILVLLSNLIAPFFPSFSPHSSLSLPPLGDIILTFLIIVMLAIGTITYNYCFSPYNFCWGDYLETFRKKRSVGKFILVGVLFTIVLGVIAGIIANYLTVRIGISH